MSTSQKKIKPVGWNALDNLFHNGSLNNTTRSLSCQQTPGEPGTLTLKNNVECGEGWRTCGQIL